MKKTTEELTKHMFNQKIVKVSYMSKKDADARGWKKRPIQILLSNGLWLTPQSDDEGNDGGSIGTNTDNIIPSLR